MSLVVVIGGVVVQASFPPLVLTLNAAANANSTKIVALLTQLKKILTPLQEVISREVANLRL